MVLLIQLVCTWDDLIMEKWCWRLKLACPCQANAILLSHQDVYLYLFISIYCDRLSLYNITGVA